jgi:hypothetical protein
MIADDIGRNRLYVPRDRFRMLDCEVEQHVAFIGAKLEIGLLNQIVDYLPWYFSPLKRRTDNGKADGPVKTTDEFLPCG